jgi:hypothetical protein
MVVTKFAGSNVGLKVGVPDVVCAGVPVAAGGAVVCAVVEPKSLLHAEAPARVTSPAASPIQQCLLVCAMIRPIREPYE